jgi:hypothetical protein
VCVCVCVCVCGTQPFSKTKRKLLAVKYSKYPSCGTICRILAGTGRPAIKRVQLDMNIDAARANDGRTYSFELWVASLTKNSFCIVNRYMCLHY